MKRLTVLCATAIALVLPLAAYAQHDHGGMNHGNMNHGSMNMAMGSGEQKDHILISYEQARQAVINQSLPDIKTAARHVGLSAKDANEPKIEEQAANLEKAADIKAARAAFAALSDEVIKYRDAKCCGDKPVVVYCSMEKKSWLQPKGDIGNPYLDAAMRKCGTVKEN